jgi:Holliday junction resolvasome RuvABC DNA-binding subunit
VLELKEKMVASVEPGGDADFTARDALVELGYSLVEAEQALAALEPDLPPEEQVRRVLKRAA